MRVVFVISLGDNIAVAPVSMSFYICRTHALYKRLSTHTCLNKYKRSNCSACTFFLFKCREIYVRDFSCVVFQFKIGSGFCVLVKETSH